MSNYTNTITVPQAPLLGNRCGYVPKQIRHYRGEEGWKPRFHVLEEAKRRLRDFEKNPQKYPRLRAKMFHVERSTGKPGRQKRGERREASYFQLLPAMIDRVNLVNMEVGYYGGTKFVNYGYEHLGNAAELNASRVKRNMPHLQQENFCIVKPMARTNEDGSIGAAMPQIMMTDELFIDLELANELAKDRERALRNNQRRPGIVRRKEGYENKKIYASLAKGILSRMNVGSRSNAHNKSLFKQQYPVLDNMSTESKKTVVIFQESRMERSASNAHDTFSLQSTWGNKKASINIATSSLEKKPATPRNREDERTYRQALRLAGEWLQQGRFTDGRTAIKFAYETLGVPPPS